MYNQCCGSESRVRIQPTVDIKTCKQKNRSNNISLHAQYTVSLHAPMFIPFYKMLIAVFCSLHTTVVVGFGSATLPDNDR